MLFVALRLTRRVQPRSIPIWAMSTNQGKSASDFTFPVIDTNRKVDDFSEFHKSSDREFPNALQEIKAGEKKTEWIWYVFPQLALHGSTDTAKYFGLKSLPEAQHFLRDPVLGSRLVEITQAALHQLGPGQKNIETLMGCSTDAKKLLSCATLFSYASMGHASHDMFKELKSTCQTLLGSSDTRSEEFCQSSIPPPDHHTTVEKSSEGK
jgi:uncharacterized protein (DUF1810 family)